MPGLGLSSVTFVHYSNSEAAIQLKKYPSEVSGMARHSHDRLPRSSHVSVASLERGMKPASTSLQELLTKITAFTGLRNSI